MKPIIISLVLLGLAALMWVEYAPVRSRKRKRAALTAALDRLVLGHKLSLEYSDAFGERVIALDRLNRKLLWVDHHSREQQEYCIPLLQVGHSRIVQEHEKGAITRLFLELTPKGEGIPFRLCFFDSAINLQTGLPAAARRARHWKTRVELYRHPGQINSELEYVL